MVDINGQMEKKLRQKSVEDLIKTICRKGCNDDTRAMAENILLEKGEDRMSYVVACGTAIECDMYKSENFESLENWEYDALVRLVSFRMYQEDENEKACKSTDPIKKLKYIAQTYGWCEFRIALESLIFYSRVKLTDRQKKELVEIYDEIRKNKRINPDIESAAFYVRHEELSDAWMNEYRELLGVE